MESMHYLGPAGRRGIFLPEDLEEHNVHDGMLRWCLQFALQWTAPAWLVRTVQPTVEPLT